MSVYPIIRVYKVPAGSHQPATDRLREALVKDTLASTAENAHAFQLKVSASAMLSRPERFCTPHLPLSSISPVRHKRRFVRQVCFLLP